MTYPKVALLPLPAELPLPLPLPAELPLPFPLPASLFEPRYQSACVRKCIWRSQRLPEPLPLPLPAALPVDNVSISS